MRRHPENSLQFAQQAHLSRTFYQLDRERIVHCTAFRIMLGKTQVPVAQINDHHRTRLTHTLEVAQISRTVARRLRLNEDLTEAIALAHDLGHPPFGHAGEAALDECLRDLGGFDHNLHGLPPPDLLEERGVRSLADVRAAAAPLVGFSPEVRRLKSSLEMFLRQRVYLHHRVLRMANKGQRFLKALYAELCRAPEQLPERHARRWREQR